MPLRLVLRAAAEVIIQSVTSKTLSVSLHCWKQNRYNSSVQTSRIHIENAVVNDVNLDPCNGLKPPHLFYLLQMSGLEFGRFWWLRFCCSWRFWQMGYLAVLLSDFSAKLKYKPAPGCFITWDTRACWF